MWFGKQVEVVGILPHNLEEALELQILLESFLAFRSDITHLHLPGLFTDGLEIYWKASTFREHS